MKKLILILLALVLCGAALAEGDALRMQVVACPEQSFSTLCLPEYSHDFHPDGGLSITLGADEGAAVLTIFKTDAPGADFDADYYLNNVWPGLLAQSWGEGVALGEPDTFNLGGRELPGRMATHTQDGETRVRLCCYDLRDDFFVRYEVFSPGDDIAIEDALSALALAVRWFEPDPEHYAGMSVVEARP